ncbi:CAP-Gly domain-containing linker protein 1 [Geodia barretti]|uniref:CAP-Gly domain-containing linker protein 1 n=1 Tax=Geodia barretti TaxID=519541 RepID=A0AA35W3W1_GEOBA|nr:CAP-Gly domain-containing linker protein 1 [Geodia barretti]
MDAESIVDERQAQNLGRGTSGSFGNATFQQIQGTAMGADFSPTMANIYMSVILQKFLLTQPTQPYYLKRYIDDILMIWTAWDGGEIDFRGGQWAGIELDEATGKNDGSLKGIRFFTCKPKFGEIRMGVELDNGGGDNSGFHSGVRYFNCRPAHGVFLPTSKVKALAATSSGSSTNSGPTTDSQLTPPSPPPPLIPLLPSTNEDSTPPTPQHPAFMVKTGSTEAHTATLQQAHKTIYC